MNMVSSLFERGLKIVEKRLEDVGSGKTKTILLKEVIKNVRTCCSMDKKVQKQVKEGGLQAKSR